MIEGTNEIIAIRFGDTIVLGEPALERLHREKTYTALLSRAVFNFMAMADLGEKWGRYAREAPTLFKLKEDE